MKRNVRGHTVVVKLALISTAVIQATVLDHPAGPPTNAFSRGHGLAECNRLAFKHDKTWVGR